MRAPTPLSIAGLAGVNGGYDTQGGDDPTMTLRNPRWAQWFDMLKQNNGGTMPTLGSKRGAPPSLDALETV